MPLHKQTKSGLLYVFDRSTGKSLFPINEIGVPKSNVPGEVTSPTQPYPALPEPYTHQSTTIDTLTNRTPEAHAWAVKQFNTMTGGGQFVPPSVDKLTIDMPGFAGGGEWGGVAVDTSTGVLYVNANGHTAWLVGLTVPPPRRERRREGLPERMQWLSTASTEQARRRPFRRCMVSRASSLSRRLPQTIRGGKGPHASPSPV